MTTNTITKKAETQSLNDTGSNPHLTVSYREAGNLINRSHTHIRLVLQGERKSDSLIQQLEPYLKNKESGIGSN